jgi:ketosteroid isomerase-like protein
MALANLPLAVATFLDAAVKRDIRAILAKFADGAVLVDRGVEHRGDAIRTWSELLFLHEGMTVRPINAARRDGKTVLTATIKRQSAAGASTAMQLDWWFTISDGRISALIVEPARLPDLPAPVASYVLAANTFDLEALLGAFAEDAVVNDQLREYWGKKAIRRWAARDIIGDHVTMYVVTAVEHYGHAIVTAHVDGDYDKRGLPDPLAVTFYFSIHGNKIIQLIILRNEPDV